MSALAFTRLGQWPVNMENSLAFWFACGGKLV